MSAKGLINQFISWWSLFLLNSALSKKSRQGKVKKMSNNDLVPVYQAFVCPKSLKRTKPYRKSFKGPYPNHVDKWGGVGLPKKAWYLVFSKSVKKVLKKSKILTMWSVYCVICLVLLILLIFVEGPEILQSLQGLIWWALLQFFSAKALPQLVFWYICQFFQEQ